MVFSDGAKAMALSLKSARTSPSGVTMNRYTPAGSVKTGSFARKTDGSGVRPP